MFLGSVMAASIEWVTAYYTSPESTNTVVIFWGGDAGATTRGPYYAAYPMVFKGVYRSNKGGKTERLDWYEYIPPTVEWLSEREAIVRCAGETISVEF